MPPLASGGTARDERKGQAKQNESVCTWNSLTSQGIRECGVEQDVMNRFSPVDRWQFLQMLSTLFQVLNQIKQQIHRAVLSGRSVLIHDGVDGDGGVNA